MPVEINVNIGQTSQENNQDSSNVPQEIPNQQSSVTGFTGKTRQLPIAINKKQALMSTKMILSSTANYAASNVGKWTGNSNLQFGIDVTKQMVSIGISAAINPALAIAQVGLQLGTTAVNNYFEDKWNNMSSERARQRSGFSKNGNILGRRY